MNKCEGCTACCEIVPVKEIGLKQYTGCPHMLAAFHVGGPGCGWQPGGYPNRPYSCKSWSCLWLRSDWAAELRPDRLGVVVDGDCDLIKVGGKEVPAAQMWAAPGHDDDWQRPEVADIIKSLIDQQGIAVLWRMQGGDAIGFWRHPKTGYGRSPRQPADSTGLGADRERLARAGEMYGRMVERQRRR